jgi:starch-binding outer membrane protein, SusD/RagB family
MKKIFIIIAAVVLFTSCEDYLDKVPDSSGMTDEDVFTDYLNFRKFEDRMYKDLNDYLSAGDFGFIAADCDEGFVTEEWGLLPIVQAGDWLQAFDKGLAQFSGVWNSWQSIRIANICLEKLNLLEEATQQQKDEIKGQANFMRAWYYYEFLRRQGGLPYITKSLSGSDEFGLPRLSFHETALKIVADCDSAAALLPQKWDNANIGRPTKGAAMALKASTLLFDASPTNNTSNETKRWEDAAKAAWDLIEYAGSTGNYKLMECKSTEQLTYKNVQNIKPNDTIQTISYAGGYDSIFNFLPYNDEIIWEFFGAMQDGGRYTTFATPSLANTGIMAGFGPSQNIVDMFETVNGLSIKDDPAYDEQNPYVNRDPRFYHCILFNGERWTSQTNLYLQLFNGGRERSNMMYYSYTGYLSRKFWVDNIDLWSDAEHPISHVIYFRFAEILMMYAEACNEIGGPDYTLSGANMSSKDALNKIRARVHMPSVNQKYLTDKATFRERIKNERAIEFYLEEKRLFDLSRWGDASKPEHKQVYDITISKDLTKPTGYVFNRNTTPVVTLTFDQKHYRWPIKLSDALMFEKFQQNPGW